MTTSGLGEDVDGCGRPTCSAVMTEFSTPSSTVIPTLALTSAVAVSVAVVLVAILSKLLLLLGWTLVVSFWVGSFLAGSAMRVLHLETASCVAAATKFLTERSQGKR